jgi:putative SOS response-associated peptidase YedK
MEFMEELQPRYNIAPTQSVLTVVQEKGKRIGKTMRWGLIPFWAKDVKIGYKMINARAETIDEKPMYKGLFKKQRCLILADGFYEWKKTGNEKHPYRFQMISGKPFAFAGLWDRWSNGDQSFITCSIITTTPNEITKEVHDRMPVILPPDAYQMWLEPDMKDTDYLKSLLQPYPADEMDAYEISTLVNSPKNDNPSILKPIHRL